MKSPHSVEAPKSGIWRVGRAPYPLEPNPAVSPEDLDNPRTGNRFDSPTGQYRVTYFGTTLAGCYGETLARFRPDTELVARIQDEWQEKGFMLCEVPRDWRRRRIAVRVKLPPRQDLFPLGVRFLDLVSPKTLSALRLPLASVLAYYGYDDLDAGVIHAQDRRITRLIGQWAYDQKDENGKPLFGGIRYCSRLNAEWELWAVFQDVAMQEVERKEILESDAELTSVAKLYDLRVF